MEVKIFPIIAKSINLKLGEVEGVKQFDLKHIQFNFRFIALSL